MRLFYFLFALFISISVLGQGKAYLSRESIKIGEQTELIYEFIYAENDGKAVYQPLQKEIACYLQQNRASVAENNQIFLEILEPFTDTLFKNGSQLLWQGRYKITAWDTGLLVIPASGILYKDSLFELPSVSLKATAPKLIAGKDIYDIKENFIEIPVFSVQWFQNNWLWLSILLFLLCATLFYLLRNRKNRQRKTVKELSLKDKSLVALEALQKAQLWQKGQLKEHYFELSYLLRSYLSARYELNLLESTSQQATLLLSQKALAADTVQTIKTILGYADMAKFAKSAPSEAEIQRNLSQARQIIIETSPLEIAHVE